MYTRGVTLIELLLVAGLIGIIGVGIATLERNLFSFSSYFHSSLTAYHDAQSILRPMVQEIRSAARSELGGYPILEATEDSITFYSDVDADAYTEQINYFTDGDTLKKTVITPTGSPLTYNQDNAKEEVLARNATVSFAYYDSTYTGSSSPLAFPVSLPDVRLVHVTISIEADPNKSPDPITVSSNVSIRNLKDNL